MKIVSDKAQKTGHHIMKENYWSENGVEVLFHPLPVGDYVLANEKVLDVIDRKAKRGVETKKMDFLGTYTRVVDTKKDIQELVGDICGKQHERFRDECILAQNNGIQLTILVENYDKVKETRDLFRWHNPRTAYYNKIKYMHSIGKYLDTKLPKAPPTTGQILAKACLSMELKYGVKFEFCRPDEAGAKVIEILTKENQPQ